jgi:hypothetical protein
MRARAAHIFDKEARGHYVEPAWVSARLFEVDDLGPPGSLIYDPACGWGTILRSAINAGYRVTGSDIVDRLHRKQLKLKSITFNRLNFLDGGSTPSFVTSIVCNPPFDFVPEFCERSLEIADYKVAMIMLLRRLPAAHWLEQLPVETIYMLTPRPSMPPGSYIAAGNKPGGGTQDFCVLVMNRLRSRRKPPVMRWLHRDAER